MNQEYDEKTMPNEFLCPIFQQMMKDPVLTIDGFCFERRGIQEWFNKGNMTNPLTNKRLESTVLVENRALRNVIEHHNTRQREFQRQADLNAQKIIKKHNERFASIYPQLVNDYGLLDLDKFSVFSNESAHLRNIIKNAKDKFSDLKKCCDKNTTDCRECKNFMDNLLRYKVFVDKDIQECLKMSSVVEPRIVSPESIYYLVINSQVIRGIDFRRTKKEDIKMSQIKGIMITTLTVEELMGRIRKLSKIPEKDFIRIWITNMAIGQLYAHIVEQVQTITGSYLCKVKCVGKKVQNWKKKVKEIGLQLQQGNYMIIEHGPGEEYVFRDDIAKCDYCYKVKKIETHCECKKVFYCSVECRNKDKSYHDNICKLNQKGSQRNIV